MLYATSKLLFKVTLPETLFQEYYFSQIFLTESLEQQAFKNSRFIYDLGHGS
jgi:hypothetical protein